jgi:hypothetical protein
MAAKTGTEVENPNIKAELSLVKVKTLKTTVSTVRMAAPASRRYRELFVVTGRSAT